VATSQPITVAMTAMGIVSAAAEPAKPLNQEDPQRLRPGRAGLVERPADHSRDRRPRPILVQGHRDTLLASVIARAARLRVESAARWDAAPHPKGVVPPSAAA
jgi:hypothetical protein